MTAGGAVGLVEPRDAGRLGPWQLEGLAAQGGMGTVWRARHEERRHAAAIKILSARHATDPAFQEAFRAEVRAVAGLDHPRVVQVFDHGVVPPGLGDGLPPGAPWLAMEWASGGTLAAGVSDWDAARVVLVGLLDALAHVHARGLVHRDLKPANVLLAGPGDLRPGLKLTDFGIARAVRAREVTWSAGTRGYMAPEQLAGNVADQGPWTDLFALGVLGWALVTGAAPPDAARGELPAFTPRFDVPADLEAWLRAGLVPDPRWRWRRAADARHALSGLGGGRVAAGTPGEPRRVEDTSTQTFEAFDVDDATPRPARAPLPVSPFPTDRDPPPDDQVAYRPDPSLGLFSVRAVRFVGRDAERAVLWSALREVHATREPRLVCLIGPTGTGKSRLGTWLVERAHETGAAHVWTAGDLGSGLAHELGVDPDRSATERLERAGLDPDTAHGLAAVLAGDAMEPRDLLAILAGALRRFGADRPIVWWIDDAFRRAELVARLSALLRRSVPVLFVTAWTEDAPEADGALLARLLERGQRVDVGPFDPSTHRELIRAMLPAEEGLIAAIGEATGGNARFTADVLDLCASGNQLVERGALFDLAPGTALPRAAEAAWTQQVARVAERWTADEARAVDVAAALGLEVDGAEWAAATEALGLPATPRAIEDLADQRLVRTGPGGPQDRFRFAHPGVRDSLLARASAAGRLEDAHRACAATVGDGLRRGQHLLAAGEVVAAARELIAELDRFSRAHPAGLPPPLAPFAEALRRAGAAAPVDGTAWLHYARSTEALFRGRIGEARDLAAAALAEAERLGITHLAMVARRELVRRTRLLGELDQALALATEGWARNPAVGELEQLAGVLVDLGRLDEAEALMAPALPSSKRTDLWRLAGVCARLRGDDALARQRIERALALAERAAWRRWNIAEAHNALGDVTRHQGDHAAAERHYREAIARFRELESGDTQVAEVNLCLVLVARGAHDDALTILERCDAVFRRNQRRVMVAAVAAVRLPCLAATGGWARYDAVAAELEALLAETRFVESDVAAMAEAAVDRCLGAGEPARARRAGAIAAAQWDALGRADRREALLARLARA